MKIIQISKLDLTLPTHPQLPLSPILNTPWRVISRRYNFKDPLKIQGELV